MAAFACGTEVIHRVDKIVGPGNLFVTLAKRAVFGEVDIDMLAGPSEVLIVADETAAPACVAADLLAQAEHSPGAAVLVTTAEQVADAVLGEIKQQLAALPRREATADGLDRFGLVAIVDDWEQAAYLANEMAPEHLELQVANPAAVLPRLRLRHQRLAGPSPAPPATRLPLGAGRRRLRAGGDRHRRHPVDPAESLTAEAGSRPGAVQAGRLRANDPSLGTLTCRRERRLAASGGHRPARRLAARPPRGPDPAAASCPCTASRAARRVAS